jgi:hypothetical protein
LPRPPRSTISREFWQGTTVSFGARTIDDLAQPFDPILVCVDPTESDPAEKIRPVATSVREFVETGCGLRVGETSRSQSHGTRIRQIEWATVIADGRPQGHSIFT